MDPNGWGPRAYAETWDQRRIDLQLEELTQIKEFVILSGGWAWHLMSPPHEDRRAVHDMKDVDIFVEPAQSGHVIALLKARGFTKTWTKYDGVTEGFSRYSRYIEEEGKPPVKIMFDVFVQDIPSVTLENGFRIVEPKHLLGLYSTLHTSIGCVSVRAAKLLVDAGINPIGRPELVGEYLLKEARHADQP